MHLDEIMFSYLCFFSYWCVTCPSVTSLSKGLAFHKVDDNSEHSLLHVVRIFMG